MRRAISSLKLEGMKVKREFLKNHVKNLDTKQLTNHVCGLMMKDSRLFCKAHFEESQGTKLFQIYVADEHSLIQQTRDLNNSN